MLYVNSGFVTSDRYFLKGHTWPLVLTLFTARSCLEVRHFRNCHQIDEKENPCVGGPVREIWSRSLAGRRGSKHSTYSTLHVNRKYSPLRTSVGIQRLSLPVSKGHIWAWNLPISVLMTEIYFERRSIWKTQWDGKYLDNYISCYTPSSETFRPKFLKKKSKQKLHGLSPRANYTDRATAACRRSDCQRFRIKGAIWSAWRITTAVFSIF
jgi:hypothetical protein